MNLTTKTRENSSISRCRGMAACVGSVTSTASVSLTNSKQACICPWRQVPGPLQRPVGILVRAAAEVGAQVLPHHRGPRVPGLGGNPPAVEPAGHTLDEPFKARVVTEPEEGGLGAGAAKTVQLGDRDADGLQVRRPAEPRFAVGQQVGGGF